MPNIKSAKKAMRGSRRKRQFNMHWKKQIKAATRSLNDKLETKNTGVDILNKDLTVLQKVLDKASKNNVIHKNKANRLKSRYAQKIAAQASGKAKKTTKKSSTKDGASASGGKKS